MPALSAPPRKPRKQPIQERSQATLQAICEAAIQVLLRDGVAVLTPTRVAERVGVSVGSLYQYIPDKRALLAAVLARHLDEIASRVEAACGARQRQTISEMMTALCDVFIDAKLANRDASLALYPLGSDLGEQALTNRAKTQVMRALAAMLTTASDAQFEAPEIVAATLVGATTGPVQAALENGAEPAAIAALRFHLTELCIGYLERIRRRPAESEF